MKFSWVGINAFARPSDAELEIELSAYGSYLQSSGDAGLLACSDDGALIGWIWLRNGPYRERVGVGYLKILHTTRVVRDLKVHPEVRGRGLGRSLVAELVRRLPSDPATDTIAFVSPDNPASVACFAAGGFERAGLIETRRVAGRRLTDALALVDG